MAGASIGIMFRRRMFRARRRFRGRRRFGGTLEKRNNYIEIAQTELGEASTDTLTLLTGADAVTNAVSNDTTTADCEKGSKIIGGKIRVLMSIAETGQPARLISYALYKDAAFGGMDDISDISALLVPSTTQTIAMQKKYAVARGKILLGDQSDQRTIFFGRRILRKLGKLREGETVKLFLQNETTTASRAVNFAIYGHITTIK